MEHQPAETGTRRSRFEIDGEPVDRETFLAQLTGAIDREQAQRQKLQRNPAALRAYTTWLRTGSLPALPPPPASVVTPMERPRERQDSGSRRASGRRSSQDPGDDDPPHPWRSRRDPWALTWAERAPVIWRLRAARCRYMQWRDEAGR